MRSRHLGVGGQRGLVAAHGVPSNERRGTAPDLGSPERPSRAWSEPKATRMRTESTGGTGEAPGRQTGTLLGPWRSTPEPPSWSAWARSPRRPDAGLDPAGRPEPLALMTAALRAAAEDCDGAAPGGAAPAGNALHRSGRQHPGGGAAGLAGRPTRPSWWRADSASPRATSRAELMVTSIGGNNPRPCMHDACRAISRGEHDVVLVTGAEAMYARALARRDPARPWLDWSSQPEGTPPATLFGVEKPGATELEMPARRHPARSTPTRCSRTRCAPPTAGHCRSTGPASARCGPASARSRPPTRTRGSAPALDARRDRHARARQPHGVLPLPQALHGQHAGRPGRGVHRVLGGGGAGRRRARGALGVPARRRRCQRPLVHFASAPSCTAPPPSALAGGAALEQAGVGIDDIAFVDLYSCFPVVVQMAAPGR